MEIISRAYFSGMVSSLSAITSYARASGLQNSNNYVLDASIVLLTAALSGLLAVATAHNLIDYKIMKDLQKSNQEKK